MKISAADSANRLEAPARIAGARRLACRLREISQDSVAARWLIDLEFMVWQDLTGQRLLEDLLVSPEGLVLPPLDEAEKSELLSLAEEIGGWVVYDGEDAEDRAAFVGLEEWKPCFDVWLERTRSFIASTERPE